MTIIDAVLAVLRAGPLATRTITERLGRRHQSVQNACGDACRRGLVEVANGARGSTERVWRLTPAGEKALAGPRQRWVLTRKTGQPGACVRSPARPGYAESHARHVELQRRLGIPEELIQLAADASLPGTRTAR